MKDSVEVIELSETQPKIESGLVQPLLTQRLAKALIEAQRRSSLDGILFVNEHRQVAFYNQRFCEIWQISEQLVQTGDEQQLLGFVLGKLQNPEEFIALVEYCYEHTKTETHNEVPLKDGRVLERRSAGVTAEDGDYYGRIWYFRDISDRKHSELALQQKATELEKALQNLQQTQTQLIQSEKMSALGNLVSGVAHEINNPVGFIAGNITPARDYIDDLLGLLQLYQEKFPNPGEEITEQAEAIDLDYIRIDLPKLIKSMRVGTQRIKDISTSLRTFSRADSHAAIDFNIHDGIDSTILILKHRLKATDISPAIEIHKLYGNIPSVKCYAGQLNQVFMNLLANAIDTIEEFNANRTFTEIEQDPSQIEIQTQLSADKQQVKISIRDNGSGMSEEIKSKAFEHLFTTKVVGKGTGLGLTIVRQIITEKHGGTISIVSQAGKGTAFIIAIPIAS